MIKTIFAALILLVVFFINPGPVWGEGQNEKPQQRDFGFGAMEIFEFSNLTSELRVSDINRDGLDDILFLNNKISRLEILTRKANPNGNQAKGEELPTLDERFTNNGFVLENWVQDFQVVDLNGDRQPDIITLDDQRGIQVFFQREKGAFGDPYTLPVKEVSKLKGFEIADLTGDGSIDILAYRQENAEIFSNNGKGEFKNQATLDFATYGCQGTIISDVNGDKIPDILLYFPKETMPLRVRLGKGNGKFGWEEALYMPNVRDVEKIDLVGSGTPQLAMLLRNGLILRLYRFEKKEGKPLFAESKVIPLRLPLKGLSSRQPPTWASADIDGDGFDDFCAAAPQLNQVHLYKGGNSGLSFSPIEIGSLRDIKSLALTGRGDIVVFSEAEKAVAVHNHQNLTAFPTFFKAPGVPVAMATAGESTVFTLFKEKETLTLNLFDAAAPGSAPFETHKPAIHNVPSAMKVFPLDGTGHWGIIFFMPYDKPVMVRLSAGKLIEVTPEHFRAIGSNLKPQDVTAVGSEKGQVLMVSEGNIVRLFRWKNDRFVVEEQLNPGAEKARLTAGCRSCEVNKGYLLYDEANQDVFRFLPGTSKPPAHFNVDGGVEDVVGLASLRLKDNHGILLVGQSEIQWIQDGAASLHLLDLAEYVSGMEKPSLWDLIPVSLGSPGRPMAAMLDANNRSVELVSLKGGKLAEELVFEVFQDPGFSAQMADNVYEPHDLASGDFNGDNIRDLAVLVHSKLIIYLGE
jgi:hypothetical protein